MTAAMIENGFLSEIGLPRSALDIAVVVGTSFTLYCILVHTLRYRGLKQMEAKFSVYIKDPHSLDYTTAHEIIKLSMLWDLPWLFRFSTQLGLVKTYAVASGTPLLVATKRLTDSRKVGKRAVDTFTILSEFTVGFMDSDRGLKALSKMNYIHAQYGSRITNAESLHTLAVFVLEPAHWIKENGWRPMTRLERVALFVYWKEIGNRMGITDIPATLEELEAWAEDFEKINLVYAPTNQALSEVTMDLYLRDVPFFLKAFLRHALHSLVGPVVRKAVGAPEPPRWIQWTVTSGFYAQQMWVRHMCLPRFSEANILAKADPETGRLFRETMDMEPWYVKASKWNRLISFFMTWGAAVPGTVWKNQGYLPEELGPEEFEKRSLKPVLEQAAAMKVYAENGGAAELRCPFRF